MLNSQTKDQLIALRLPGMLNQWELISSNPSMRPNTQDEFLGLLTDAETQDRSLKKIVSLRKKAKLKHPQACVENIDYLSNRELDKEVINSLLACQWMERAQNVIFTGPTGLGKSWLACMLGNQAIKQHKTVLYKRHSTLHEEIELARGEGTLTTYRNRLKKADVLIIDDWALVPMSARGRNDLLDIVEDKSGSESLIFTSQLPINRWHDYIGDPTVADAILDRIIHNAHRIELNGDSLRAKHSVRGKHHD